MLIGNLKDMIGRAVGAISTEKAEPDPDQTTPVPNRRMLRNMRRSHYAPVGKRRHSKPRSRTGRPDWFRSMKFMAEVKKTLPKVPLDALLPDKEGAANAAVLDALRGAGYKSVWDLSQASRADLLRIKGIGPKTLADLRAMMVARSVPVAWK